MNFEIDLPPIHPAKNYAHVHLRPLKIGHFWDRLYLRSKSFRANRANGPVSANGPDVFASRFHNGRLQIIVGEVKASRSGFAGIGALRWNTLNTFRQMSYSWVDKYASDVLEGIIELGISGIGKPEFRTLLERGEVDMYLMAGLKHGNKWDIKGFRLLHLNLGGVDIANGGDPEITAGASNLSALPGY